MRRMGAARQAAPRSETGHIGTIFESKGSTVPETAYALAFDTANEVISIGLGRLNAAACAVEPVAAVEVAAHRASNTQLLVRVDALLRESGVERGQLACVCVGRGPGSFTGVRIAMAPRRRAPRRRLGAALVGVSSLDVVAWHAWASGVRGRLAVVADAMRKEVYPVRYALDDAGAHRLEADRVVKAQVAAQELVDEASSGAVVGALQLTGDGTAKYAELFAPLARCCPRSCGRPRAAGFCWRCRTRGARARQTRWTHSATTRRSCCRCTRACRMPRRTSASAWRRTT